MKLQKSSLMTKSASYPVEAAQEVAVRALTFLTGDAAILSRFLTVTGWTPATLAAPGSRAAILTAALDYLMSEEDLLLTFTANCRLDPTEVACAHRTLQGTDAFIENTGG